MVTVPSPTVAVLLAVKVTTLVPVVGLVPKTAVTPVGRPDAARVTAPLTPPQTGSVTVTVSVAVPPCTTLSADGEGESVKFSAGTAIVRDMVVDAANVPDVPVIVIAEVPAVQAVGLFVSVSTLEPVVGLVANAAVMPAGRPEAASVTAPVNPPMSVTVMVSVALLPGVTERVAGDGVSVKPPIGAAPQVTPFTANDVGTELVEPFHVPLNPTPCTLAPAATLPL